MKLYFVRHGKTKWNPEGRYQGGGGNSPLLPESEHDITLSAQYLSDAQIQFSAIYASPLQRAAETAVNLNKQLTHPVPIILDARIKEFNLGKMEGMKFVDAEKKYPEIIKAFRYHPDLYDPKKIQGEDFNDLIKRGQDLIFEIIKRYDKPEGPEVNILIVSHGAALVALIRSLLGVDMKDLRKRGGLVNTSLTCIETENGGASFEEVFWNKTDFLDKKLGATDTI